MNELPVDEVKMGTRKMHSTKLVREDADEVWKQNEPFQPQPHFTFEPSFSLRSHPHPENFLTPYSQQISIFFNFKFCRQIDCDPV
jgi:hypothetical protein